MRWGRLILLAALTGTGCGPSLGVNPEVARYLKDSPPNSPPDVKPSEVNETNFRDKLKQLDAELAHDEMTKP